MGSGLNDREYRVKQEALKNHTKLNNTPCWICNEADWDWTNWKAPRSFTADHVKPRGNGGHLLGKLKPAHRSCNASRSNRVTTVDTAPVTATRW